MSIAYSKLTAQGQISVPAEIRKRLGIGPGSVLEWDEQDGVLIVKRAGRFSSEAIHEALFPAGLPAHHEVIDVKQSLRKAIRKRHAGD